MSQPSLPGEIRIVHEDDHARQMRIQRNGIAIHRPWVEDWREGRESKYNISALQRAKVLVLMNCPNACANQQVGFHRTSEPEKRVSDEQSKKSQHVLMRPAKADRGPTPPRTHPNQHPWWRTWYQIVAALKPHLVMQIGLSTLTTPVALPFPWYPRLLSYTQPNCIKAMFLDLLLALIQP